MVRPINVPWTQLSHGVKRLLSAQRLAVTLVMRPVRDLALLTTVPRDAAPAAHEVAGLGEVRSSTTLVADSSPNSTPVKRPFEPVLQVTSCNFQAISSELPIHHKSEELLERLFQKIIFFMTLICIAL